MATVAFPEQKTKAHRLVVLFKGDTEPVVDVHGGATVEVAVLGVAIDALQRLEHRLTRREDPVREQEGVEEVDRQEPQIRQPVQ